MQHIAELFQQGAQILAFTETWDFKEGYRKFDAQNGYNLFTCCRSASASPSRGRQHGGIALYIQKSICGSTQPIIKQSHADKGILCVIIQSLKLAIIVCYFSPEGANGYEAGYLAGDPFLHVASTIANMQQQGFSIMLLGDMNARVGTLTDCPIDLETQSLNEPAPPAEWLNYVPHERKSRDLIVNSFGKALIEVLRSSSIVLLNGRAPGDEDGQITCFSTRGITRSGSVVDLACLSAHLYPHVSSLHIFDSFQGEHMPLVLELTIPSMSSSLSQRNKVHLYRPTGDIADTYSKRINEHSAQLATLSESLLDGTITAESAVNEIVHIITTCMRLARSDTSTPHVPASKEAPWWCDELHTAREDERFLRKAYNMGRTEHHVWHDAKVHYRRLKKHHKRMFHQRREMDLISTYYSFAQRIFWQAIRPAHAPSDITNIDEASKHVQEVFLSEPDNGMLEESDMNLKNELYESHQHDVQSMLSLNEPITVEEVEAAIAKLPNMKASGADGITAECFKAAFIDTDEGKKYTLAPIMTALLNSVFMHRDFPSQFNINTLTLVYKGKGDRKDLNSYRGIAVGSLFCKVFEAVLYKRYNDKLEYHGLRDAAQFGFRPNHGTLDGLFVLRHLVDKAVSTKAPLYALFIDFEKAFDRVPRRCLVDRCKQLGCSGEFLDAIVNMLANIQMQIKCNRELGSPIHTSNRGIKQGGLLSPLKFGSFMEQLHELIRLKLPGMGPTINRLLVPILMYADDVTALATSPEHMQRLIDHIEIFCKIFGMKINASKTFGVIFHRKGVRGQSFSVLSARCKWCINGTPVAIKKEAKFLGLIFHCTKGCMAAPADLAAKGNRTMHATLALMNGHHINQSAFLCRIFDQLVKPVLGYGCQVWGPDVFNDMWKKDDRKDNIINRKKNPLEGIHIDFLRRLGGLPSSSPLWILFREFHRTPLHFHWLALCTRFWCKAVKPSSSPHDNVLLRAAMHDNVKLYLEKEDCWFAKFIDSLVQINVVSHDDLSRCNDIADFMNLHITEKDVKQKLLQYWSSMCNNVFGVPRDPRALPDDTPSTYARYMSWVASQGQPSHLTTFIPTHMKHMIIRFRCTSFPLAVQKGRRNKIPRSRRFCRACLEDLNGPVEDDKHFLIECPIYDSIRTSYRCIFNEHSTPQSILNYTDQAMLAKALHSMLQHRSTHV